MVVGGFVSVHQSVFIYIFQDVTLKGLQRKDNKQNTLNELYFIEF